MIKFKIKMTISVVYGLSHPSYENSDSWILGVYQDENKAKEIVDKLNQLFSEYTIRRSELIAKANIEYRKTENDDVFKEYRENRYITKDEMTEMLNIHPRALDKYNCFEDELEYRCEKTNLHMITAVPDYNVDTDEWHVAYSKVVV
jgi:hypothetical protein